jgi:methionyl-tRNA formyltransferase
MLLQKKIKIDNKINAGELHDKLKNIGAQLVYNTIDGLLKRKLKKIKQQENQPYNTAYKFDKENIKLNWNLNGIDIYNKIRGLSPFPGSRTTISSAKGKNKNVIIYDSDYIVDSHNLENGSIINEKGVIKIACSDGYIIIKNLKIEGRKRMDIKSFLNGFNLENYYIAK